MQLRYKAYYYAGDKLYLITELKDMPVFKAKQIVKARFMRDNKVTVANLIAYGFEQKTKYKITRINPKWKIEE